MKMSWLLEMGLIIIYLSRCSIELAPCIDPDPAPFTYRTFPDNQSVEYRCMDNYHLVSGNLTRTCEEGTYTGNIPICMFSCGTPLNTSHAAKLIYSNTTRKSTVTYICANDSLVSETSTICQTVYEMWREADRCYSDIPLDRSRFTMKGSTAMLADVLDYTGYPSPSNSLNSFEQDDIDMFGVYNAIDDGPGISLESNSCSSTRVQTNPYVTVELPELFDIYKVVITFPNDTFAFPVLALSVLTSDVMYGYNTKCAEASAPIPAVFEAICSGNRYGSHGLVIIIRGNFHGMLQICDIQVYGRPIKDVDCGQPSRFPFAFRTTTPVSTKFGNDSIVYYSCIEGFTHKKGLSYGICSSAGNWYTSLKCTDHDNLALDSQVTVAKTTEFGGNVSGQITSYNSPVTDGDVASCYFSQNISIAEFVIELSAIVEVSDVSITFQDVQDHLLPSINVTVYQNETVSSRCTTENVAIVDGDVANVKCKYYPVGVKVSAVVYFDEVTPLHVCEIAVYGRIYQEAYECFLGKYGKGYKGKMNRTITGIECQRWDTQFPHRHTANDSSKFPDVSVEGAENYCRNPIHGSKPWCYTMNPAIRWQYCPVEECDKLCILNDRGRTYKGNIRHTRSGGRCVRLTPKPEFTYWNPWYCRNSDLQQTRPWCYTKKDGTKYEHCFLPKCPTMSDINWSIWPWVMRNQTVPGLTSDSRCHVWKYYQNSGGRWLSNMETFKTASESLICREGITYNATILCWEETLSGTVWTIGVVSCVFCGSPPPVSNATVASPTVPIVNSTAAYTCDSGFTPTSGERQITCLPTGQWEPSTFRCVPFVSSTTILTSTAITASTILSSTEITATPTITELSALPSEAVFNITTASWDTCSNVLPTAVDWVPSSETIAQSTVAGVTNGGRIRRELCACRCKVTPVTNKVIRQNLFIDKKSLSSQKAKKVTIPDSRPTSMVIGYGYFAIVLIPFVVIFVNDLIYIVLTIRHKIQQFKFANEIHNYQ